MTDLGLLEIQFQLSLIAQEVESHTMKRSCAIFGNARAMLLRGITCIPVPTVVRILLMQLRRRDRF